MGTKHTHHTQQSQTNSIQKNLVFCIDEDVLDPEFGASMQYSSSNLLRFHNSLLRDATGQSLFYFSGAGAPKIPNVVHYRRRRDEVFATLVTNYRAGDKVFLFGAGSGAAVALAVANLLEQVAIPDSLTFLRDEQGRVMGLDHPPCSDKGQERTKGRTDCKIEMLGAWDTLKRAVVPREITGTVDASVDLVESSKIPAVVRSAYHLVGIDDHRVIFEPGLFDARDGVEETWVMGLHEAAIGTGRGRLIADIPLLYMITAAKAHGLVFYPDALEDISPNEAGLGVLECEQAGALRRAHRSIHVQTAQPSEQKPRIHFTVLNRMKNKKTYRPPNLEALKGQFTIANGPGG